MYEYKFPMAAMASDIVVFNEATSLFGKVLLIRRSKTSAGFPDQWALPGGFVDLIHEETFLKAAARELREETGLYVDTGALVSGQIYDAPHRDPRKNPDGSPMRVLSHSFYLDLMEHNDGAFGDVKAGDDATEFKWVVIADVVNGKVKLAFDHKQIIIDGFAYYKRLEEMRAFGLSVRQ